VLLTSENAGSITRKMGVFSVEQTADGTVLSAYINNYEVENYFLKGIAFANEHELQSLNGATYYIKRTDFYGSVSSFSRSLNRHSVFKLRK
jgi:hypothetical protein